MKLIHFFFEYLFFVFVEFSAKMILKGNSKGINHNLLCRICIAFFRIQQKLLEFSNITAKNYLLCIFFATQTVQSYSKLYRFFLLSYISTKNFLLFLQYSAQLSTLLPYFCNLLNRNDLSSLVRIYIFTKRHDNRANGWIAVVKKETSVLATDSHRASECICPIVVLVFPECFDRRFHRACTRFFWYYREFSRRDKDRLAWKTWIPLDPRMAWLKSRGGVERSNQVKKTSSCIL